MTIHKYQHFYSHPERTFSEVMVDENHGNLKKNESLNRMENELKTAPTSSDTIRRMELFNRMGTERKSGFAYR